MINATALLNVARALRESPRPEAFTMAWYQKCGTPGCAFGHWAHRSDLQNVVRAHENDMDFRFVEPQPGSYSAAGYTHPLMLKHFGLTRHEADELFDCDPVVVDGIEFEHGCGGAMTAIEAAEYIEMFVASRT